MHGRIFFKSANFYNVDNEKMFTIKIEDGVEERNPRTRIMKSADQQGRILEPEKTYSSSSPFIHLLFIMYFTATNNKRTSKVVTPYNKRAMAEDIASWSETALGLDEDNYFKLKLQNTNSLFLHPTISYFWS